MNHHKNNHNTVFNIISWNIQGLKTRLKPTHQGISNTKLNIKSIKANLSKFDVICLQETWAKDDSLTFEGYAVYSTIRSSKSKRGQGGVSVLIKNKHSNLVTHINSSSPYIIWCRLHKSLLRLESDIYLATVYSPPHISGSMDTTFSTINLWQQWNKWKYKFCKLLGRNIKFVRWWNLRKTDHSKRNPRTYIETKTKKASSMDSILNEMINGRYFLLPSLEKIFNDILNSRKFPTEWNIGLIQPIYKKKSDRRSPANYRGITLTSRLGKLFTSILPSRLNKYMEIHNILNPEQFGFRPNARTTDSLFILQEQLLHKYTKQHEKLYVGCWLLIVYGNLEWYINYKRKE